MRTIYANRPLLRRLNGSAVIVVIAFVYGLWELWRAVSAGEEGSGYGFMFAALFIGGGVYGMRQLVVENGSMVARIDADGGKASIQLWRPFLSRRIEMALDGFQSWRFEAKTERRVRIPMLVVDHPDHAKPLCMELGKGIVVADELRALAPEAMAKYEEAGG